MCLFQQGLHNSYGRTFVTTTKVVPVIQVVEELVKLVPLCKSWCLGNLAVVCRVKSTVEATKHPGNTQLKLRVAVEGSRIEDDWAVCTFCHVSSP